MMRLFFALLIFWPITSYTADGREKVQSEESFFDTTTSAKEALPNIQDEESEEENDSSSDDMEESDEDNDFEQSTIASDSLENKKREKKRDLQTNTKAGAKKRYVPHPNASKGLFRITRDRVHLYKVKRSEKTGYSSVRLGLFEPKKLKGSIDGSTVEFEDAYEQTNNITVLFDYEWQWLSGFGELSYKLGTGLYVATGHGQFTSSANKTLTPPENFTLIAFPNSASLVYRLKFWDSQFLIPYFDGGVDLITFSEIREDDSPKFAAAYAGHGAAGISFSIGSLSRSGIIALDRSYGVNDILFTIEYRLLATLGGRFDFGGEIINAGVTAEF